MYHGSESHHMDLRSGGTNMDGVPYHPPTRCMIARPQQDQHTKPTSFAFHELASRPLPLLKQPEPIIVTGLPSLMSISLL